MNPTILGVIGPGFLNQVPTFIRSVLFYVRKPNSIGNHLGPYSNNSGLVGTGYALLL